MYIEKVKNNGIEYLRLVESVYNPGVKGGRKKTILNIGALSKFDDGEPDYVQRLKKSFKNGCPLIPALLPYCEKKQPLEKYKLEYIEGDPYLIGDPKLYFNATSLTGVGVNILFLPTSLSGWETTPIMLYPASINFSKM